MHIPALPPADSFADVLAWDDAPATGLTDADLRALRDEVAPINPRLLRRLLWYEIRDSPHAATWRALFPDEVYDDAPPDEIQ